MIAQVVTPPVGVCEPGHDGVSPVEFVRQRLLGYHLTPREAEIVLLVARGMCNKEIATYCGIALQTVKDHLKHAYVKVGAHQRTAVMAKLIGL